MMHRCTSAKLQAIDTVHVVLVILKETPSIHFVGLVGVVNEYF